MKAINSKEALEMHIKELRYQFDTNKYLRVDVKTGKQRTNTQNAALHKYLSLVAEALNECGITFRDFFKDGVEVPWTMEIVKDNVWRPVQEAVTGKESTAKCLTGEYSKIYEYVNLKLSERGVFVAWPSIDTMDDN